MISQRSNHGNRQMWRLGCDVKSRDHENQSDTIIKHIMV